MAQGIGPGKVIDDVSMAADITSDVIDIQGASLIGFWIETGSDTTTHAGTFYVQLMAAKDDTPVSHTTSVAITAGAANRHYLELASMSAPYIRLFYDRTSGDGALTVKVTPKRTGR